MATQPVDEIIDLDEVSEEDEDRILSSLAKQAMSEKAVPWRRED